VGTVLEARADEPDTPRTIFGLWARAISAGRDYPAYLVEESEGWRSVTWEEAGARVDELTCGFLALGVAKGDRVAVLSRSRLEWTLCDFALASLGAVVVPIYLQSSADDTEHIVSDSGARAVITEGGDETRRVGELAASLPELELVVQIERGADLALDDVVEAGRKLAASRPEALHEARSAVAEDDVLTIIYTSGTTGKPKGCVLSHRNFTALTESVARVEGLFQSGDRAILFLPLAHNFARLVQYCSAGIGVTLAFCPDPANVGRALATVRPTLFPSVPRLFEKAYSTARAKMEAGRAPNRWLASWAVRVGGRVAAARDSGTPTLVALQHRIADRLVLAKVRARLGGELRLCVSGGAPLAAEIIDFFAACGVPILEGYGLTETTSACTINRPGRIKVGSVGPPLPGIELSRADDGEILVRGETVFRGYYRNDEATAGVLRPDGWLLSGDIGVIDEDGSLTITDRKKEIIVTAGGKKIAPQNVENALVASGYFERALVIGDRRPYLVALLSVDRERIRRETSSDAEAAELVERVVEQVNAGLGRAEQVKRFAILPRDLSIEEGEITPTLKLRRRVCEEHFRYLIDVLYAGRREATPQAT
jgi:long-chain acyl-CoA synthetase